MDYLQFAGWLKSEQESLILPAECRELTAAGSINPLLLQWVFRWAIHFSSDNKYLRIWELHDRVPKMIGMSHRTRFVFHYGPLVRFEPSGNPEVDYLGTPRYENSDPVDVRIDTCSRGPRGAEAHIHYGAPTPHHKQDRVKGLDLATIDMFTFLRAVLRHRETGESLDRVLGFRIL